MICFWSCFVYGIEAFSIKSRWWHSLPPNFASLVVLTVFWDGEELISAEHSGVPRDISHVCESSRSFDLDLNLVDIGTRPCFDF